MAEKNSALVAVVGLAAIAVVLLYLTRKPAAKGNTGGLGGSGTAGTTAQTTGYPVTLNSSPTDILKAFVDSGYMDEIQGEENIGSLPAGTVAKAKADPVAWLNAHPYLQVNYPNYFSGITAGTTPNSTNSVVLGGSVSSGYPQSPGPDYYTSSPH